MNTAEFKVGQKWRVVDADTFNGGLLPEDAHAQNGELITITNLLGTYAVATLGHSGEETIADLSDATEGCIILVRDVVELPQDVSPEWATSVPEDVESVSEATTDNSTDNSKDILWHIISRAEKYNGNSQFSVSDMDLKTLVGLTRMLDDYVTEFCELRLSWGGDHMGYYTADIYEIAGTSSSDDDKILMQIEKVTGIS